MTQKRAKTFDRFPVIFPAGIKPKSEESVGKLFKENQSENHTGKCLNEKVTLSSFNFTSPATPIIPEQNQLKDVLSPDLNKSRFLEFKDKFYEDLYCKKIPLGKSIPANSKPNNISNENTTFGKVNVKSESVYDIAFPNKCTSDVLKEFLKGHEKYKLSHGNYFPSEQVTRGYNDNFNAKSVFGKKINVDSSGNVMKNILQNQNCTTKNLVISNVQANFIEKHASLPGQPLRRQNTVMLNSDNAIDQSRNTNKLTVKEVLTNKMTPEELSKCSNETSYRLFATDRIHSPAACSRPAGLIESIYPRTSRCRFFVENLGEETRAKDLITPNIPMQFGLSHRDFLLPRSKNEIKRIFTNSGYDLKDDQFFEKVWSKALTEWTSSRSQVSVEAFKYALLEIKEN